MAVIGRSLDNHTFCSCFSYLPFLDNSYVVIWRPRLSFILPHLPFIIVDNGATVLSLNTRIFHTFFSHLPFPNNSPLCSYQVIIACPAVTLLHTKILLKSGLNEPRSCKPRQNVKLSHFTHRTTFCMYMYVRFSSIFTNIDLKSKTNNKFSILSLLSCTFVYFTLHDHGWFFMATI